MSPGPLEAILEDCYVGEVERDKGLAVEVNWELCMGKLGEAEVQMLSPKELEGSIQQPSPLLGETPRNIQFQARTFSSSFSACLLTRP